MTDWDWLLHNPDGQFLEHKSGYDRSGGRVRRRDVRSVARDLAESLSAMANADGGTVVIGVEDDGTPTGVDYPDDRLAGVDSGRIAAVWQGPRTLASPLRN
ncbi:MAG: helix-turn-helix domain-containing protein [Anaerolineae bacterium]